MKKVFLTAAIVLLSAAPAVADETSDEMPLLPLETGEEICRGELASCEAGLASCATDREVWQALANECLGLPADTSLADARKKRVERRTKPKKKRARRRKVTRKRTPKPVVGPMGPAGEDGKDGADGTDGHSIVWSMRRLKPGKTCLAGGYLMLVGLDADDDRFLDPTEAADLMAVCHGRDGKDGRDGNNGVRPTLGTGVFVNALYAHNRPNSYAVFATASLGWPLSDSVSLTLEGGAAPGRDAAMTLRVGVDWRMGEASGLKIGGLYQVVGLTDNAYANDQFALLSVGAYKDLTLYEGEAVKLNLRGELSGLIGVDAFINADRKGRKAYGVGGGAMLRLEF